ncbi:predicted protein [Naegleria gruberi]|uniref:Predicted protein n=1 Tax=Naegleria gruberi TaxID=5762 RepID=D2VMR1_NAEGR|nr:uncharacterized protein NAEGRDRAFT_70228 [Naegleria gruberi]EFC41875.1 predicted protein [Naegleria gruberi]|eukprot:XP_002674619.1 predicted protein [Naegleria gruberi strain NEG-M]
MHVIVDDGQQQQQVEHVNVVVVSGMQVIMDGMQHVDEKEKHADDTHAQHDNAHMHECESSGNVGTSHATANCKVVHVGVDYRKVNGKKEMTFVDETWNVKKKIRKKQDESSFKISKLRKSLSTKPFLDNYFEYDNSNGTNQLKKFKLIECSQSNIVTSEIIENSNEHATNSSMQFETHSSPLSETKSNGDASTHASDNGHSNVVESPPNNENVPNDNISILLALLYLLTGDSNEQTQTNL